MITQVMAVAHEEHLQGKLELALSCYSDIFELLSEEADKQASAADGTRVQVGSLTVATTLLSEAKKKQYLRRDNLAAIVSNKIGVIYAELGQEEDALHWLRQAIELTPDGEDYPEPQDNLKHLYPDG